MFRRHLTFLIIFFSTTVSLAQTVLPRQLSAADRVRALEILGFGTAPKVLSNPYPLGGYSGVEVGLSSEFIQSEDLASLGSKAPSSQEFNFYNLSLGKGLFYNVDTHFYFTPFMQSEKIQSFGGQLRWGFYEARFFPLSLSANIYGGGANFSNLINVTTYGADLIGTVNMDDVAIYFGLGTLRAVGNFVGGADGINDVIESKQEEASATHTLFGISIDFSKIFIALEFDRYVDSVYSGKIGVRF